MNNKYKPTKEEETVEKQLLRHDQQIRDCFNKCLKDLKIDLYIKDYTLKKGPIDTTNTICCCCCCAAGYYMCPCNC